MKTFFKNCLSGCGKIFRYSLFGITSLFALIIIIGRQKFGNDAALEDIFETQDKTAPQISYNSWILLIGTALINILVRPFGIYNLLFPQSKKVSTSHPLLDFRPPKDCTGKTTAFLLQTLCTANLFTSGYIGGYLGMLTVQLAALQQSHEEYAKDHSERAAIVLYLCLVATVFSILQYIGYNLKNSAFKDANVFGNACKKEGRQWIKCDAPFSLTVVFTLLGMCAAFPLIYFTVKEATPQIPGINHLQSEADLNKLALTFAILSLPITVVMLSISVYQLLFTLLKEGFKSLFKLPEQNTLKIIALLGFIGVFLDNVATTLGTYEGSKYTAAKLFYKKENNASGIHCNSFLLSNDVMFPREPGRGSSDFPDDTHKIIVTVTAVILGVSSGVLFFAFGLRQLQGLLEALGNSACCAAKSKPTENTQPLLAAPPINDDSPRTSRAKMRSFV